MKRQVFEDLWQTSNMTITKYEIWFSELAQYARHMAHTERDCIKRFITQLVDPLYMALATTIDNFKSYSQAIDCEQSIRDRPRGGLSSNVPQRKKWKPQRHS